MEELVKNQAELVHAIDSVWVALCAALIFQMEGGFALLEAGFVRSKNSISIIAKVIIDVIFGGIAFYAVGFAIAYGRSNGWFAFGLGILDYDLGLGLTVSNSLFWFIQMGFAVAAISIVSGAIAERMKVWAYAAFVVLFCALIYPMAANWAWNPKGWLALQGFKRFCGFCGSAYPWWVRGAGGCYCPGPTHWQVQCGWFHQCDSGPQPDPGCGRCLCVVIWLVWFQSRLYPRCRRQVGNDWHRCGQYLFGFGDGWHFHDGVHPFAPQSGGHHHGDQRHSGWFGGHHRRL